LSRGKRGGCDKHSKENTGKEKSTLTHRCPAVHEEEKQKKKKQKMQGRRGHVLRQSHPQEGRLRGARRKKKGVLWARGEEKREKKKVAVKKRFFETSIMAHDGGLHRLRCRERLAIKWDDLG